ncbi:MAG: OmpA family protein [Candidatus Methylomirabilia bacterium]
MMRHLPTVLSSILCVSLALAGCVASSKYAAKEQEAQLLMDASKRAAAHNRELTGRLKDLEQKLQALARDRDQGWARAGSLEAEVRDLTEQYEATAAELDEGKARAAALEDQLRYVSRKHGAAAARAGSLEGEVRDLSDKHRAAAARAASLQGKVMDLSQERQAALKQAERLRQETELKEQQIANLRATYHELVSDLQSEIKAGEIKVTQYKNLLTVNLVDKILFDSGKAEIRRKGRTILTRLGEILKNVKDKEIRVEGHTDNVAISARLAHKYATNWELSTARATVVARYFQDKVKIPATRLAAAGFGEYRPVAPNTTPEGRAENRRIEIILAPLPPASDMQ